MPFQQARATVDSALPSGGIDGPLPSSKIDSLLPSRAFSRRDFVRTSVGSGFAAAVLPAAAQTAIRTDADGLTAGEVTVPVGDFRMPAYRALPAGKSGLPVLLVVSEIFGVHAYIADVVRRFAKQGYLAIAPELFERQGDAQAYGEISRLIAEVVAKTPDAQVRGDLDAVVAWAKGNGGDVGRLGITGFCWGGRTTWMYAAHNPNLKAGVAWYGQLARANFPGDRSPIDEAARIRVPVLGLYGGADAGIPLEAVQRMRDALKAAGNTRSELIVYPDVPHAFHADYRPSYRPSAAEDGWKRCLAWFRSHGVA